MNLESFEIYSLKEPLTWSLLNVFESLNISSSSVSKFVTLPVFPSAEDNMYLF